MRWLSGRHRTLFFFAIPVIVDGVKGGLLRAPVRLLRTRLPWMSVAYLVVAVLAGWVTWLSIGTVVLVPIWAGVWAAAERHLVTWVGFGSIAPRAAGWASRLREVAFVLALAVVALLGVAVGVFLWAAAKATLGAPFRSGAVQVGVLAIASPVERGVAFVAGVLGTGLVLWLATAAAWGLAQVSMALLSPRPEQLQRQVDDLVDKAVEAEDRVVLERKLMEQRLHDGAQLHLSAAGFRLGLLELELVARDGPADPATLEALREVRGQVEAAADAVRDVAHGLTPQILTEQGLGAALQELTAAVPVETTVTVEALALPEDVAENLYLIASEAITNAIRHSGCSRIEVSLVAADADVRLTVRDDGRGGAVPRGQGILGMAARARRMGCTFDLFSPDGGPTEASVRVPVAGV